jgi:glutathione peroxidase
MTTAFDFTVTDIRDRPVSLTDYKGKVLLIVNTASQCGFTPQYKDLQALYERFKDRDFALLGFPCNQFGAQEPGSNAQIQQFCDSSFNITFPLFAKIDVNGEQAAPLYKYLRGAAPGVLGSERIKWNFTKFLVSKDGQLVRRYAPITKPASIAADIESML